MIRRTAGILAAALAVGGCTAEPAVSPLPTETATSAAVTAAPPAPSRPPAASPRRPPGTGPASASPSRRDRTATPRATGPAPRPRPATASSPPSCQGAVVHTIDLTTDELALVPALCLGVGAVLRLENIGPGEVTTDPPELVDQNYEAGIVEIRLLRAGTVVVTVPQAGVAHEITVVAR